MKLTMEVRQFVRCVSRRTTHYRGLRQSVRGIHGHGAHRDPSRLPPRLSSSWSFGVLGAGVAGIGITSWQFAQHSSRESEEHPIKYADKQTMLDVSSMMCKSLCHADYILLGGPSYFQRSWARLSDN
jgi:hypothetical protein